MSRPDRAPFRAAAPAVPESVPRIRRSALEYLRATETPDPPLNDIALVISEAVSNAVLHAYVDREPGEVRLEINVTADDVQVVIEDDGRGLTPRLDSPGLGLGLPLMARLTTHFDTKTAPGAGTRMCAWFSRNPADAELPA